jgi:hypothetical protein
MKLAITLALALGLATATLAAPAHACGFVSPEDEVRRAFIASGGGGWDDVHAITFLDDGRARVEVRRDVRADRVTAQYHWFIRDEDWNWVSDGSSYRFTVWTGDSSADARPPVPRKQRLTRASSRSRRAVAAR